jgi:hypothetical protein
MNYSDGRIIKVGDRVELWPDKYGVVVCSIDDEIYTAEFSKSDWSYLKVGIMVKMDDGELMHYSELNFDLKFCG